MASPQPGSVETLEEEDAAGAGSGRSRVPRLGLGAASARAASWALGSVDGISSALARLGPALFFDLGTGEMLERLAETERAYMADLLSHTPPPPLDVVWTSDRVTSCGTARVRTITFASPLAHLLPPAAATARAQLITPALGPAGAGRLPPLTGLVLHFAATADQTQRLRRKLLALPLLQRGVASLLLLPAFYGQRRPPARGSE